MRNRDSLFTRFAAFVAAARILQIDPKAIGAATLQVFHLPAGSSTVLRCRPLERSSHLGSGENLLATGASSV